MTKLALGPNIFFVWKIFTKQIILNKMAFYTLNWIPSFVLANIIVNLMAWPHHFKTHWHSTLTSWNIGEFCFLKLDNAYLLVSKKDFFHQFMTHTKNCHENRKPPWQTTYTIQELGSRRFPEPGFKVSSYFIPELELVKRCGTQISANTWTGSYQCTSNCWIWIYTLQHTQKGFTVRNRWNIISL